MNNIPLIRNVISTEFSSTTNDRKCESRVWTCMSRVKALYFHMMTLGQDSIECLLSTRQFSVLISKCTQNCLKWVVEIITEYYRLLGTRLCETKTWSNLYTFPRSVLWVWCVFSLWLQFPCSLSHPNCSWLESPPATAAMRRKMCCGKPGLPSQHRDLWRNPANISEYIFSSLKISVDNSFSVFQLQPTQMSVYLYVCFWEKMLCLRHWACWNRFSSSSTQNFTPIDGEWN